MKFKFDIDCTPEEARQFLGLPNVAAMQDAMMQEVQARLQESIRTLDPETFIKTWMPSLTGGAAGAGNMQAFTDMQKAFWGQMGMNTDPAGKK